MVTHTFNLSTLEAEEGESLKLEASLVYRANSGNARATERNTVVKGEEKENHRSDAVLLLCLIMLYNLEDF